MRGTGLQTNGKMTLPFIIYKVREKGVIYCFKAALRIIRLWLLRFSPARGVVLILPPLRFLFPSLHHSKKRILAILDLRVTPSTYGEVLTFQEVTLIERLLHGADKIDIIWLCDPKHPARSDQRITPDNYYYYLSDRLPLAYVNPYLGSFLLMDSSEALEDYIKNNAHRYHIMPSVRDYLGKVHTYREYFDRIQDFYRQCGYIPHLSCQPAMVDWARSFMAEKVRPHLPVVVHIRNDRVSSWDSIMDHNAKIDCWLEFFSFCEGKYSIKFVVICGKDEVDPRFRNLQNVIIAKDYCTTVEQDLALIQVSLMFMGGRSGVCQMAMFNDIPYIVVNFSPINENIPHGAAPVFATPLQRWIWESETTELLIDEFTKLFDHIDINKWEQEFDNSFRDSSTKLKRQPKESGGNKR